MDRLARYVVVPLLFRLVLAVVFIHAGMGKLGSENEWGAAWLDRAKMPSLELSGFVQILVAWGEFIGGLALGLGFLTRIASLGLIAIMIGAIVTLTGSMGFAVYQINVILIVMLVAVILLGPGPVSLDRLLWGARDPSIGGNR